MTYETSTQRGYVEVLEERALLLRAAAESGVHVVCVEKQEWRANELGSACRIKAFRLNEAYVIGPGSLAIAHVGTVPGRVIGGADLVVVSKGVAASKTAMGWIGGHCGEVIGWDEFRQRCSVDHGEEWYGNKKISEWTRARFGSREPVTSRKTYEGPAEVYFGGKRLDVDVMVKCGRRGKSSLSLGVIDSLPGLVDAPLTVRDSRRAALRAEFKDELAAVERFRAAYRDCEASAASQVLFEEKLIALRELVEKR